MMVVAAMHALAALRRGQAVRAALASSLRQVLAHSIFTENFTAASYLSFY